MKETKITCDLCGKEIVNRNEQHASDIMDCAADLLFGTLPEYINTGNCASIVLSNHGKAYKTFDVCYDCVKKLDAAIQLIEKEKQNERQ